MSPPSKLSISTRAVLDGLQAWFLPSHCLLCDEAGLGFIDLCTACYDALPWLDAACIGCALPLADDRDVRCGMCRHGGGPLASVRAAFLYQWPVDLLLRRFKFDGDLAAGRVLAQLMARRFAPRASGDQVLVPVPLHARRVRARGYDQAAELVRPLSLALGLPWRFALRRRRSTAPQSTLDAAARHRNVRGAFECVAPAPKHVVLVDDVMTTGATLHAAARVLRRAGAVKVDAWVCARVP